METTATTCRVAAQAICVGTQDYTVRGVTAAAARSGRAVIAVRVGRVLIYLEDRDALDCWIGAWQRAAAMADDAFGPRYGPPPPRAIGE